MGRPFIVYSSDDEDSSSADTASTSGRDWQEDALGVLQEAGLRETDELLQILRWLHAQRRTAYLPRVEASAAASSLTATRIGGKPYLLPTEDWPRASSNNPLVFLWQFRVPELPRAVQQALGHQSGLLQVFLDEELNDQDGKWFVVRVLEEGQLVPRPASEIVQPPGVQLFQEKMVVRYDPVEDWPHTDDLYERIPDDLHETLAHDVLEVLSDSGLIAVVSGDKLLGWPHWCQSPEWKVSEIGEDYIQVLQVEGTLVDFAIGDSGTLLIQRHPQDRNEYDISWACC